MTAPDSIHGLRYLHVLAALALTVVAATGTSAPRANAAAGLPLTTTRSIEFTTDEGTWMSVDIAPSGEDLVFDLVGDLYLLPRAGGTAQPLTHGPAFDVQPRFSPDGRWIAFISDRDGADNLWIMRPDGSEMRRMSDGYWDFFASPAWLPDSTGLVVSRGVDGYFGGYGLWQYRLDGSAPVQLANSEPERNSSLGAAVSADQRYIYFARRADPFEYSVSLPIWQVVRLDLKTGDEASITAQPGSAFRPVLSPDGKLLAYGARFNAQTGLRLRELASGADRWLIRPVQRDDQESSLATMDVLPGYAFTPDSKALLAAYDGKIRRIDITTGQSQVVPFKAHIKQSIGPDLHRARRIEDSATVRARIIHDPVLAPGGRRAAFTAFARVYVVDLPNGQPQRLTRSAVGEFQPAWSPDGQWLAYVTWDENAGGALWKTRADGSGEPVRLTNGTAFYSQPAWSPDGTGIAVLRKPRYARLLSETFQSWPASREGSGHGTVSDELLWLPIDGRTAQHVTLQEAIGPPHFVNAEPQRIYLSTTEGLMSYRRDGSDRRLHLRPMWRGQSHSDTKAALAPDIQISPNGRQALVRAVDQWLYRVDLPNGNSQSVDLDLRQPSNSVERITTQAADFFAWTEDGKTVTWSVGSTLFRKALDGSPTETFSIQVERPRHRPLGVVMLRNARVITLRGDEIIPHADILIRDNRIAAVGLAGSVPIPVGAQQIDLSGKTIVPGFIDVHAHWRTPAKVLDRQPWGLLAPLAFGVTTGRDPSSTEFLLAHHDMVEAGMLLGPRAFTTAHPIDSSIDVQSLDEAREVLTRYSRHYGVETIKSYAPGNRRQRQWIAMASREQGVTPTTEGWMDFRLAVTYALDGYSGHEHNIPQVPLFKDIVELFAKSRIMYTPTLLVSYGGPEGDSWFFTDTKRTGDPKIQRFIPPELLQGVSHRRPWVHPAEQVFPLTAASAAKIARAGGRIGVGAHGQLDGPDFHWEMWALHADGQGLTPMEILRAATIHAAEAIGYGADLGSIEPGKLADLLVLSADPLTDIYNTDDLVYVMKNGELFDASTLTQIWPEKKPLQPLWWWR
jgi:Tol biopolymer transport system component